MIEGGEVEVDNSVLQMLKDPLTHLVRNAVDHGIEPVETRKARGKSPCGSITLRSRHDAGGILIEIEDDGAGLDRAAILARARSHGLVAGDTILDDAHVLSLVFEPGFSTAEEVSEVSGRGVGLDVVRRNVQALRGAVAIEGRPGEGTRLTIRLPLTLAIIEGLVARVDEERYVIPIETVGESLALPSSQAAREDGRGVLSLRDRAVPWVRLRTLFGITTPRPRRELAVVIQTASGPAGLVVDQMEGQGQVVIKPLPKVFEGLRGITASAVLGTGRVALILDAAALLAGEAAPAAG